MHLLLKGARYVLLTTALLTTSFITKEQATRWDIGSGINLTVFDHSPFLPLHEEAIEKIITKGFSAVAFNPIYRQETSQSSMIDPKSKFTLDHLADAIQYSHERGLEVILKPMINPADGTSRTRIMPRDLDQWFASYASLMEPLVHLAIKEGVEHFVLVSELDSLVYHEGDRFNQLMHGFREQGYEGEISVAVVFNNDGSLPLVESADRLDVDATGIDFYMSYRNKELQEDKRFYEPKYYLERILERTEKPVWVTEVGYRSVEGGDHWPMYNYRLQGRYDAQVQQEALRSFLEALRKTAQEHPRFLGSNIWITDRKSYAYDIGVTGNPHPKARTGYTPFNKPAEEVIADHNRRRIFLREKRPSKHK